MCKVTLTFSKKDQIKRQLITSDSRLWFEYAPIILALQQNLFLVFVLRLCGIFSILLEMFWFAREIWKLKIH